MSENMGFGEYLALDEENIRLSGLLNDSPDTVKPVIQEALDGTLSRMLAISSNPDFINVVRSENDE